jgi:hypothetical protein
MFRASLLHPCSGEEISEILAESFVALHSRYGSVHKNMPLLQKRRKFLYRFSPYDKFCVRDGNSYLPYIILPFKVILVPFKVGRNCIYIQI